MLIEVALLVSSAAGALQQDPIVRDTAHFHVRCHFESKRAADEAAEAAEAVWELAARVYDLSKTKLEKRLGVNLYPNASAYDAVDSKLTKGRFKKNQAFAHFATKTAHVALQPAIPTAEIERRGLPTQTKRLIAHEAAHLVRYSITRNFPWHPRWLADGAASWIDYKVSEKLGLCPDVVKDPYASNSIAILQRLLARKKRPSVHSLLDDEVAVRKEGGATPAEGAAAIEFYEHYSMTRWFFTMLMEGSHRPKLHGVIKRLTRLGQGKRLAKRLHRALIQAIGKKQHEKLDREFADYVASLEPEWSEVVRSLETHSPAWRQLAFSSSRAVAWRTAAAGASPYEIKGRFAIEQAGRNQLTLLLGRSVEGYVSVTFKVGFGINVFRYEAASEIWHNLLAQKVDLGFGEKHEFSVAVDGRDVRVHLDGKRIGEVETQGQSLDGPWGLGAQHGSVGTWHVLDAPGLK